MTATFRLTMAQLNPTVGDVAGNGAAIGGPYVEGDRLYNAYHICRGGVVVARQFKHYAIPNGPRIGSPICEDAWYEDVAEAMVESGAEILVVPNGSPFRRDKFDVRMSKMVARVVENDVPLVYVNMVGGQDDQVYDGGSFVLNRGGKLAVQAPLFDAGLYHVDFEQTDAGWVAVAGEKTVFPDDLEQDYRAMVESLRDYCGKTRFGKVLLGLSGGIDSAIVATIAADALGPENVRCVMLPSEYTAIIDKPPSAELRPDQRDDDSLPPYDILDGILRMLVDQEKSVADCVEAGFERETVKRVEHLLYISEYKRFQSAPGTRLSNRAFWLDRRYPIVNGFRDQS